MGQWHTHTHTHTEGEREREKERKQVTKYNLLCNMSYHLYALIKEHDETHSLFFLAQHEEKRTQFSFVQ